MLCPARCPDNRISVSVPSRDRDTIHLSLCYQNLFFLDGHAVEKDRLSTLPPTERLFSSGRPVLTVKNLPLEVVRNNEPIIIVLALGPKLEAHGNLSGESLALEVFDNGWKFSQSLYGLADSFRLCVRLVHRLNNVPRGKPYVFCKLL